MQLLNLVLDNIDEAIVIMDGQGQILQFNRVAEVQGNSLMMTLQQGKYLYSIARPNRKKIVQELLQEIERSRRPEKAFAEYTNQQGTTVYLDMSYVPIVNEQDILTHILLFVRDITVQKIFERKFANQAANIGDLIEKANAIIIGVDTLGYITDWNEHCSEVTGFGKEEVFARKLVDVLKMAEGEITNQVGFSHEVTVRTKNGKSITLLLSGTPRRTPAGEVVGYAFVGHDVTELSGYRRSLERKVEERTRELQRALRKEQEIVELKSRFVSIASHEFRTPLSTIQYSTNFLRVNPSISRKELFRKLDTIEKQVMHMTHLLDDVLSYSKSEAGRINLNLSPVMLADFLQKIIEEVGHSTGNTHTVCHRFHNLPETINTDEKLLRNITINILTNAIKFSPDKTSIDLIVEKVFEELIITVRDEGIGIPSEEISKIFEPFLRGKTASAFPGTGLGLSIVKKATEMLGGNVKAESEVGKGTTFVITIPEILPT